MTNPKPNSSKEMPWTFYAFLSVFCAVVAMLIVLGVLDFSDKPGVKRGLLVVFTGLHEIFGPAGPAGLAVIFALVFGYTAHKKRKA